VGDPRSLENSCDKNSEQEFETNENFEQRKRDHIRWALDSRSQTSVSTGLDRIEFVHEAIPDMDFSEVNIQASFLGNVAGSSSKKISQFDQRGCSCIPFFY
jgi:hypothetical protein